MKYAIIYASKAGGTEKTAGLLKEAIEETKENQPEKIDLYNLVKNSNVNWQDYDYIVVGTAIYASKPHKKVLTFLKENSTQLLKKPLSIFVCCLAPEEEAKKNGYARQLPADIVEHADRIGYFGGRLILKKMNFFMRWLMKRITKSNEDIHKINHDNIRKFAKGLPDEKQRR